MLDRLLGQSERGECRHAAAHLWDLRQGELPAEEAQRIHRHLACCEHCSAEMQFAERAANALVEMSSEAPPSRRGWEEIRTGLASKADAHGHANRRPLQWALGVVAATIFAVVLWPRHTDLGAPAHTVKGPPLASTGGPSIPSIPSIPSNPAVPSIPLVAEQTRRPQPVLARRDHPAPKLALASSTVPNKENRPRTLPSELPVTVHRSPEPVVVANGAPPAEAQPTLVTGSLPASLDTPAGTLVTGSAPAAAAADGPTVSVEGDWSEGANP